jgi:hypothetical protein
VSGSFTGGKISVVLKESPTGRCGLALLRRFPVHDLNCGTLLEIDGPKHLHDGVEFRLHIIVFGKLRMNNLIQCIRHPFVKAFPGMRCSSGYFSMYVRRNP